MTASASTITLSRNLGGFGTELSTYGTPGTDTSYQHTESYSGAFGSTDVIITFTALNGDVLNVGAANSANLLGDVDMSFSLAFANQSLNAGYSLSNLGFTHVNFSAANADDDSGSVTVDNASGTWVDNNAGSDFAGHRGDGSNVVELHTLNGGTYTSSFSQTHLGGSYDVGNITVVFDVNQVPEPTSATLLSLSGLTLLTRRIR